MCCHLVSCFMLLWRYPTFVIYHALYIFSWLPIVHLCVYLMGNNISDDISCTSELQMTSSKVSAALNFCPLTTCRGYKFQSRRTVMSLSHCHDTQWGKDKRRYYLSIRITCLWHENSDSKDSVHTNSFWLLTTKLSVVRSVGIVSFFEQTTKLRPENVIYQ